MENPNSEVTQIVSKNEAFSNFSHLYKTRPSKEESQENRRLKLLEQQKKKRHSQQDHRRILDLVQEAECIPDLKCMDVDVKYKPPTTHKPNKYKNPFRNQLMFSEWMEELPGSIINEWLMVPCPVGKRMLVVANKGLTKAYTKHGQFQCQFRSALPGGGLISNGTNYFKNLCTVLDCVYSDTSNAFYILDVLAWGNQTFTECEAEFRFFWLQGKLSENEELTKSSNSNPYTFICIPRYECREDSMSCVLSQWPLFINDNPALDGLLFYHKKAFYTAGYTPTVLWLFAFMVPEVISSNIIVHIGYMCKRPLNYQNQRLFIENFNRELNQKNSRKKYVKKESKITEMDVQPLNELSVNLPHNEIAVTDSTSEFSHNLLSCDITNVMETEHC